MPKQNTSPADYPQAVLQQIQLLGQNIAIARKRRGETQGQWAGKLGVSQPTMARIERGDPSVAMASYVMCMWLINQADGLADLIAPLQDHAALEHEVLRVRAPRKARAAAPAQKQQTPGGDESPDGIRQRALASAAKGNATARGLAALLLDPPGAKAR
jgi:DNA-binding XRE family transcriptional regulator